MATNTNNQINNFAGFSTDLKMGAFPEIDEKKYPEIYSALIRITNGIRILQQYLDLYVAPVVVAITSEDVAGGAMVNLYSNAGVLTARNAHAVNGTKPCHVFALGDVSSGGEGQFQSIGSNQLIGELVPGTEYYLSDVTPGHILASPPVAAGHLIQSIGVALTDSHILFRPAANWKQL